MKEGALYTKRYRLVKFIGEGAVGEVWLARDLELESDIALKFLQKRLPEEHTEMLRRETRQARQFSHRHILPIYDFLHPEGERAAISMQYAPHGSLSDLLSGERSLLEVSELNDWVLQACDAVTYLHEDCGIVHRDIKPGNLLIDEKGSIRLSDFGLSNAMTMELDSRSRETLGRRLTLHFASPQQIWNPHESHHLNDIYALGVTIFQLVTGTYPFSDPRKDRWAWNPDQLFSMSQRRAEKNAGSEAVPERWDYAVAKCLAENPTDRPRSARELAELLSPEAGEQIVTNRIVMEADPGRSLQADSKPRIGWSVIVILLFAALGLIGGILKALFEIFQS